ncbi:MAG: hypothetical protein OXH09_05060 [Gammaproteobacteria bacterium]|nr:hypothetical protein [Gammaproteobacteria bacterium]
MVKVLLTVSLLLAAALAWAAWWIWTDDGRAAPPQPSPPPAAAPPQPSPPPAAAPPQPPPASPRELAEAEAERLCPWPPDQLSWQVLDAPCREAMDSFTMSDSWRRVLDDPDPLGTRRAVVDALENPECRVPPGEARPDLRETCAASAMVQLAHLQARCALPKDSDVDDALDIVRALYETSDLAEYHGRAREQNHRAALAYWRAYRCRSVPPAALEWVEALPPPPRGAIMGILEWGVFFNVDESREITQAGYLLEAARRLGLDLAPHDEPGPSWATAQLLPPAAE